MGGGVNFQQFKDFQKKLEKLDEKHLQEFNEASVKELAARLLAKVIKRTPVGKYDKDSDKHGGTLRRGWTAKEEGESGESMSVKESESDESMSVKDYVNSIEVKKVGNSYQIKITNPVYYASYVEYGHRAGKTGFVEGRFMLRISEKELQKAAPKILQRKLEKFLGDAFK